jgi:hypothetical protein
MSTGERVLSAAYVFGFASVLAYVVIVALRLARLQRVVAEFERLAGTPPTDAESDEPLPLERDAAPASVAPPAA